MLKNCKLLQDMTLSLCFDGVYCTFLFIRKIADENPNYNQSHEN